MTDQRGVELRVELDPLREPISGRVTDCRGRHKTFSGWLDLMEILDRARDNAPPSDLRKASGAQDSQKEEAAT